MKSSRINTVSARSDHGQHLVDQMTQKDLSGLHEVQGKKKYNVYSKDPYGLWYIEWLGKEPIPRVLDSAFTSQTEAFKAIDIYEGSLK